MEGHPLPIKNPNLVKSLPYIAVILSERNYFEIIFFRYLESPWLCNLDWSSKNFRGKAYKTKKDFDAVMAKIKESYEDEDTERSPELVISVVDSTPPKRPVHMPGYPELVG